MQYEQDLNVSSLAIACPPVPGTSTCTRVQGKEIASLVEIDHWRARVVSIQIYTNQCICSTYGISTR